MKNRTVRLAVLLAAMAVSVSMLAGCATKNEKKENTSTASASTVHIQADVWACLKTL